MKKVKLKAILALIGFAISVYGFLYCYTNPNVWSETCTVAKKTNGNWILVNLDELQQEYGTSFSPIIDTIEISHIDYWNQDGFVAMAIGLSIILLGLVLGDTEFSLR